MAARTPHRPATPAARVARDDGPAGRAGRRAALALVGTALLWAFLTWAGGAWGVPERLRALIDLFALAGFGLALYLTWQAWRVRQAHPE